VEIHWCRVRLQEKVECEEIVLNLGTPIWLLNMKLQEIFW
jgi:hypothetical protein